MPPRKVTDVPPEVVDALNRGERETRDLVEGFTIDFAALLGSAVPGISGDAIDRVRAGRDEPYTKRFRLVATVCLDELGPGAIERLRAHPSDTVRGWACYAAGLIDGLPIGDRLAMVRTLADDHHFGVREWAWLGVRGAIVAEPREAIRLLMPWAHGSSANLRRFASEATRPRGVWAAHIKSLKDDPSPALPLLDPLRSDPSRYVQDSVANWLNDASKSRPDWVRGVCDRWRRESDTPATARLCARAERSI